MSPYFYDPAGYSAGMNLYAYVMNDPANATDPSGMVVRCAYYRAQDKTECVDADNSSDIDPSYCLVMRSDIAFNPRNCGGKSYSGISGGPLTALGTGVEGSGDAASSDTKGKGKCGGSGSVASKIANLSGSVSNYAAGVALLAGGAAILTSETIVGGIGFGAIAGFAGGVSLVATGVQGVAQYYDRNFSAMRATIAGGIISLGLPAGFGRMVARAPGVSAADQAVGKFLFGIHTEALGIGLSNACL